MRETQTKKLKETKPRESLYVRPGLQNILASDEGSSQKVIPQPKQKKNNLQEIKNLRENM